MEKFNIDNFYVGKLTFVNPFSSLEILDKVEGERKVKEQLIRSTINSGAIDLRDRFYIQEYNDLENMVSYQSVYTMFYKGSKGYFCFHNFETYNEEDEKDHIENLIMLKDILPKIGFVVPDKISVEYCWFVFNSLFKNKKKFNYNHQRYNLNDFYIGTIELCTRSDMENGKSLLINLPESLMLESRGLSTLKGYIIDYKNIKYHYNLFKSIFYKKDNTLYDLYGNYTYSSSCRDIPMNRVTLEEPFREKLEKNNIKYNRKTISVPKVLRLQKDINRK